jgi:hypothetical protein
LVVWNSSARDSAALKRPLSRSARLWELISSPRRRKSVAYALYERLDRRLNQALDDPLAELDCAPLLAGVEAIGVEPITKGFTQRFPPEAIGAIRSRELDVLLRFGFNILRGEVLTSCKYGVWSYHHGDNDSYRGGPAHFWEIRERNPLSGVVLQVLTEELDAGLVLAKGTFATTHGLSVTRNRQGPYWGSTHFVIQKLYELHRYGWDFVRKRAVPPRPYAGKKAIYRRPTNLEVCRWLLGQAVVKTLLRFTRRQTDAHWRVAVRVGARRVFGSGGHIDMSGFSFVDSPRGHYYADPFLHSDGNRVWLFFEDFEYSAGRATIRCASLNPDGSLGDSVTCLAPDYHVSYPFVFTHQGQTYMIPESKQNRSIQLFRASAFPTTWDLDRVLMKNVDAVDVSLWVEGELCFWFVTVTEPRGNGSALLAAALLLPWPGG